MTLALCLSLSTLAMSPQMDSDEARIREARAASNEAIRDHDAERLASFWTEDYSLVASTNLKLTGREKNRQSMASHFEERPDVVYVRTPNDIGVYAAWGMAWESGAWEGRWTEDDGTVEIGGRYFAKWQETAAGWRILAEIFVPTRCDGTSYCDERP